MRNYIIISLLLVIIVTKSKAQTLVLDSIGDSVWNKNETQIDSINDVVTFAEQMPEFKGGHVEMMKFINKNLIYPKAAKNNNIEGRVVLQFIVNFDGSLSSLEVVKSIGYGCDEEAQRLVNLMPNWSPGKQNGQIIRCRYTLIIVFK
jgi:TonB family protein